MQPRGYKHLTARDRLLIAQLRAKKFNLTEIALRIGKDKSTVSRELRRNAINETPGQRFFIFRISNLWSEEQLDAYLATRPAADRCTRRIWTHADAQHEVEHRAWKASQKRRRKKPATRAWVVEKLRLDWSPE